ncbi:hypothetical protein [Neptunomonas sp.]|uniref:hypothetical protein n=1 Tax=Neptunomonas TaxID=75687 RepID=UPI003516B494
MLKLGLLLLIVPCVLLMGGYIYEYSLVDSCRAQGGSFDYLRQLCDNAQTHPFIPFMMRHPLQVNGGMLLAVVGLCCCVVGLYKRG